MTVKFAPLRVARVAAPVAALAAGIWMWGVSPAEAVRAVKHALNADAVDGLSASKSPKSGQLLALGKDKRFPSSILPGGARGPRGPEGPAGAMGPQGPSGSAAVYIARNNLGNQLPTAAAMTIVELRLPAGAYTVDFDAHTYLLGPSTFVDCHISVNGSPIVKTATYVGQAADATIEAVVSMNEAVTLTETSFVRALCSERNSTAVELTDARLRAARATTVVEQ